MFDDKLLLRLFASADPLQDVGASGPVGRDYLQVFLAWFHILEEPLATGKIGNHQRSLRAG